MSGSIESSIEGDLPTEKQAEVEGGTIWFRLHGLIDRCQSMLTNRHSDRGPSDYEEDEFRVPIRRGLREPYVRIDRYDEGGGGKQSWRDWILGIVGGLIVLGIGAVIYQLADMKADLRASLTRQEMDEKRLDRVEARVYRGTP
jgi:hypothetical protein